MGVTASLKVLHAGDGYRYLTRQTASADVVLEKGEGLVNYYAESGNPPGRWLGKGAEELGLSGVVEVSQMAALYGECRHPDADRMEAELIAGGMSAEEAMKATQLGRALQTFKNAPDDYDQYVERSFLNFQAENGRAARRGDESFEIRFEATRNYVMMRDGQVDVTDADVRLFMAERGSKNRQPVSGYDVVFTPVKSVSTLWALADAPTQKVIEEVHDRAVREGIDFLEKHAAVGRQGTHSVAQVDLKGLTVAAFDHATSRTGDPNLHTHAVIANRGVTHQGKWLALDARVLHQYMVAASETYNNAVLAGLNRELGLKSYAKHTRRGAEPVWELQGVQLELMKEFSSRRAQIEPELENLVDAYKRKHGHAPSPATQIRLAQEATLATRPEKDGSKTLTQERVGWRRRAARLMGLEGEFEISLSQLPRTERVDFVLSDAVREHVAGLTVQRLEEKRSRWTYSHIHSEAPKQLQKFFADTPAAADTRAKFDESLRHVTFDQVRDRAGEVNEVAAFAMGRVCMPLTVPELIERPAALRRMSGESVMRSHHEEWVTSSRLYNQEQTLLAAGQRYCGPVVDPGNATLVSGLSKHALLPSQEYAARRFLGSGLAFDAAVGPAGTGKTTTMKAFVEGAKMGGARVVGLSPTLVAAGVLGDEIGAKAESIQKFLSHHEKQGNVGDLAVGPDTFILIDEIGMASTPHLAAVLDIADRYGACVRGIGDPEQLGSPGAGGFLRYFHERLGAAELQEVMRFTDPLERDATLGIRAGNTEAALHYIERGRVHGGTHAEMLDGLYTDWTADIAAGRDSVMIARSNEDVRMLAGRAQADRVERGEVALTSIALDGGSDAEIVNYLGIGDDIVTREVNRQLKDSAGAVVTNGATWTVVGAHEDGAVDVIRHGSGATATLPAEYVSEHVDLAYSSTIARVQGRTVDVSRQLADETQSRQDAYVGASRGRDENHFYLVTEHLVELDLEYPVDQTTSAKDVLEGIITRNGAELTASATLEQALTESDSLRSWLVEYDYAQREFAPDVDHQRVREVLQAAFGDHSAYVRDDSGAWAALSRHVAAHDRSDGDVVAALRARVEVHELAADPSPGRLVVERLGEIGPGRRTADSELNGYLAAVEERIKVKLADVVDDADLPRGRDVDQLRKAWGVRLADHVDAPPLRGDAEALQRAQARLDRLRALEAPGGREAAPGGLKDAARGLGQAAERLGRPDDPTPPTPGRQL